MKKTYARILGVAVTLVLLAGLIAGVVPVGATITTPAVKTLSSNVISTLANYTMEFQTSPFGFIVTPGGTITVQFPSGYVLPAGITADLMIDNGPGTPAAGNPATATVNSTARTVTIDVTAANAIHQASTASAVGNVQLILYGVRNPDTPGDYSVQVKTSGSGDTTYVTSNSFSIVVASLPTLVTVYNSAGYFIGSGTLFSDLPAGLINDGVMIKLDPGTYPATSIDAKKVKISPSTGSNANTTLNGFTFNGDDAEITNLKLTGSTFIGGADAVISDCMISSSGGVDIYGDGAAFNDCTISRELYFDTVEFELTDSMIDLTSTSASTTGVYLYDAFGSINGCTFKLNGSDAGIVIDSELSAGDDIMIENNAFTGTAGAGVVVDYLDGATATISDSSFSAIDTGVVVLDNGVAILNNTFDGIGDEAIYIDDSPSVNILGNEISNGDGYSVYVAAGSSANDVIVTGNSMMDNADGLVNAGSGTLLAVQNWWGDPTGPYNAATNPNAMGDPVSANVTYRPFVGAPPTASGSALTIDSSLPQIFDFTGSTGVYISGFNTTTQDAVIVSERLSGNPVSSTPSLQPLAYFDVYTGVPSDTGFQIKFFASVTSGVRVMYFSELTNSWVLCDDQGLSGTLNYAFVNVGTVASGINPTVDELSGTYFALVTGFSPQLQPITLIAPIGGTQPLTNVTFAWNALSGATSYGIKISASANFATTVANQSGLSLPVYQYTGAELEPGTTYYWQVMAYQGTATIGQSNVGYFTAATPPPQSTTVTSTVTISPTTTQTTTTQTITSTVLTTTTTTTTTQPITFTTVPPPTFTFITQPAPSITITQPAPTVTTTTYTLPSPITNEVTPTWIYVIVGIGAVLVIVVIVLIVRTRRTV